MRVSEKSAKDGVLLSGSFLVSAGAARLMVSLEIDPAHKSDRNKDIFVRIEQSDDGTAWTYAGEAFLWIGTSKAMKPGTPSHVTTGMIFDATRFRGKFIRAHCDSKNKTLDYAVDIEELS